MSQERRALDANAISVMVLLTAFWGFQQVTIKWIAADVSLVMQAAYDVGLGVLRSATDFNLNTTLYGFDTFGRLDGLHANAAATRRALDLLSHLEGSAAR